MEWHGIPKMREMLTAARGFQVQSLTLCPHTLACPTLAKIRQCAELETTEESLLVCLAQLSTEAPLSKRCEVGSRRPPLWSTDEEVRVCKCMYMAGDEFV